MTSCSLAAIVSRRWSLHFCFVASDLSYARAGGGSGGGGTGGRGERRDTVPEIERNKSQAPTRYPGSLSAESAEQAAEQ